MCSAKQTEMLAVEIVKAVKPKLKSKYILEMDHIHVVQ